MSMIEIRCRANYIHACSENNDKRLLQAQCVAKQVRTKDIYSLKGSIALVMALLRLSFLQGGYL